jgi:drug/metabolite transporter (DMT)-like permease
VTSTERAGLGFAAAEVLAVGLVPAFSKYAMDRIDPLLYSAGAVTVAAAVAMAMAAGRGELRQIFVWRSVVWLVPIAFLGTTVTTLLLFFGARLTDGVSTALLLQAEPAVSLALTWLVWRRRVPAMQVLGTALTILGISLVLYDGTLRIGLGGLLIVMTTIGWQLSHLLALRVMPPMSPYALTAARYLYGGAVLVGLQMAWGSSSPSALWGKGIAMVLFHGSVLFFCGTLFWYETIRRLDLARATAIVAPGEPLMSLALVWLLLGALPNRWQAAGLLLLLPGVWLLVSRFSSREAGASRGRDRSRSRRAAFDSAPPLP